MNTGEAVRDGCSGATGTTTAGERNLMADRVQNCFPNLPLSIMSDNGLVADARHCLKADMKKLPCLVAQVVGA